MSVMLISEEKCHATLHRKTSGNILPLCLIISQFLEGKNTVLNFYLLRNIFEKVPHYIELAGLKLPM